MPPLLVCLQAAEAGHHGFGGGACWDDNDSVFSDFDEETFTSAIDNVDELVYFGECFQGVLDCAVQCGAIARRAAACCIGLHTRLLWPHGLVIRCFDAAFISREAQLMQSMAGAISAEVQQQLQQHLLASHHRKQELAQAAVSQLASSHLSAISQGAPHIAT